MKKLIYIMDAQCGWCYGNAKNITSIYEKYKDKFDFELLSGGMWIGENAPQAGEAVNRYISSRLPQLVAYTNAKISDKYKQLIANSDYILSSLEPSAATVLLKKMIPESTLEISKAIQHSYFAEGKRLDDAKTYIPIIEKYKISRQIFEKEWLSEENLNETYKEFQKAKSLTKGFPSFHIQDENGIRLLAAGYFDNIELIKTLDKE